MRRRSATRGKSELSPAAVLTAMTDHRAGLRALLDRYEPAMLARRPASGDWSAIENIRHLLFAEQVHLGRFVPGGLGLSPMDMLRKGLQRHTRLTAIVGTNPTTDLAAVFDEWERVHAAARAGLDLSQPALAVTLRSSLRHQQTHGKLAARALRQVTAQAPGTAGRPAV